MELDFEVKTADVGSGAFVVSVTGEADLHTASEIEDQLRHVLDHGGQSAIVDLVEVAFIDSTVLGLLLRFQPRFRARNGDLVLVSDDRRVLRTFEITGLDRIFRIERRLGDAVGGIYMEPGSAPAAAPLPAAAEPL